MKRAKAFVTVLLVALLVISSMPTTSFGSNHSEDWSDGPGDANSGRNGISKSEYVTLWNLDQDGVREEPKYEVSEQEAQDNSSSWKELANLAFQIDFSSYDFPDGIQKWNGKAKNSYQSTLQDEGESTTLVPPDDTSNLEDGRFIQDAYIGLYSIDPSTHLIDSEDRDYVYTRPSGRVVSVVDYREELQTETSITNNGHRRVSYSLSDAKIAYHQLSSEENCNSAACRIDRDAVDKPVRALKYSDLRDYRGIEGGEEETLYLRGKIQPEWDVTVEVCAEPDEPDDPEEDGTTQTPENNTETNETSGNETEPSDGGHTTGPISTEDIFGSGVTTGPMYSHADNEDGDGECDDWEVDEAASYELEEDSPSEPVYVSNSFTVKVQEKTDATVKYAEVEDGYQVYISSDNRWTYADIAGKTAVSSGWRIFSSRDRDYTELIVLDGSGGDGTGVSQNERTVPSNPPLRANVYPDSTGVKTYNQDTDNSNSNAFPEIINVTGERTRVPELPGELTFRPPKDQYPQTEYAEFTSPRSVVVEVDKNKFNPSGKTEVTGVLEGSTSVNMEERQITETNMTIDVTSIDNANNTANISVTLETESGEPINTTEAGGSLTVDGTEIETNESGVATGSVKIGGISNSAKIEYDPEQWWDSDGTVYSYSETYISPGGGFDIWSVAETMFFWGLVIGSFYMLIRYGIREVFEVDIHPTAVSGWERLKDKFDFF